MPIPIILGVVAGVIGAFGASEMSTAHENNQRAENLADKAESIYDEEQQKLEAQRESTTQNLNTLGEIKLKAWGENINAFVQVYNLFKDVQTEGAPNLDEELKKKLDENINLQELSTYSLEAVKITQVGVNALGTGALAGIAAYGGTMALASASTGTAISALSGVAAQNAALAYLGGGSLAAGGLGIAGGAAVLGGVVLGPLLAVAGSMMSAKSEENLEKAHSMYAKAVHAVEEMKTMESFLVRVQLLTDDYSKFIAELCMTHKKLLAAVIQMHEAEKIEQGKSWNNKIKRLFGMKYDVQYPLMTQEHKHLLHILLLYTQLLKNILCSSILNEKGSIPDTANENLLTTKEDSEKLQVLIKDNLALENIDLETISVDCVENYVAKPKEDTAKSEIKSKFFGFIRKMCLGIVLIIVLLGILVIFFGGSNSSTTKNKTVAKQAPMAEKVAPAAKKVAETTTPAVAKTEEKAPEAPAPVQQTYEEYLNTNYKKFTDSVYGYSFLYPKEAEDLKQQKWEKDKSAGTYSISLGSNYFILYDLHFTYGKKLKDIFENDYGRLAHDPAVSNYKVQFMSNGFEVQWEQDGIMHFSKRYVSPKYNQGVDIKLREGMYANESKRIHAVLDNFKPNGQ